MCKTHTIPIYIKKSRFRREIRSDYNWQYRRGIDRSDQNKLTYICCWFYALRRVSLKHFTKVYVIVGKTWSGVETAIWQTQRRTLSGQMEWWSAKSRRLDKMAHIEGSIRPAVDYDWLMMMICNNGQCGPETICNACDMLRWLSRVRTQYYFYDLSSWQCPESPSRLASENCKVALLAEGTCSWFYSYPVLRLRSRRNYIHLWLQLRAKSGMNTKQNPTVAQLITLG